MSVISIRCGQIIRHPQTLKASLLSLCLSYSITLIIKLDDESDLQQPQQGRTMSIAVEKKSPEIEKKERRDYLGFSKLTLISCLQLLFDLMIPIMIGVFTLVLMKSNQDISKQNRLADLERNYIDGNNTVMSQYIRNVMDFKGGNAPYSQNIQRNINDECEF